MILVIHVHAITILYLYYSLKYLHAETVFFLKKYIYEKHDNIFFSITCTIVPYLGEKNYLRCTKDEFSGKLIIQPQILFKNLNE